ncbi:MAG TPA: magnesium/cobalt transporter CorA [Bacillota bacterium]|nr:magnesium/cobalt transporter CorA [Bacillota bacterium]
MIRTFAITHKHVLKENIPLHELLADPQYKWYWIDFQDPTVEEGKLLETHFHFHPLAIEDCFHFRQRSKLDYYDNFIFFILHSVNQAHFTPEEIDLFVSAKYLITFHYAKLQEIEQVVDKFRLDRKAWEKGPMYNTYLILDRIVDDYFPLIYEIEDRLNEIEGGNEGKPTHRMIDEMFDLRSDLLHFRRTVIPMRDLLYRIVNSSHLDISKELKTYFADIYDHLLKLTEMIESNRDMTSDIRDSYLSLNSNRMNSIMMTLTVISSVFIPLTFIVGVYGMNFQNMPELKWHDGYYMVWIFMAILAGSMIYWFKKKGWFDQG